MELRTVDYSARTVLPTEWPGKGAVAVFAVKALILAAICALVVALFATGFSAGLLFSLVILVPVFQVLVAITWAFAQG